MCVCVCGEGVTVKDFGTFGGNDEIKKNKTGKEVRGEKYFLILFCRVTFKVTNMLKQETVMWCYLLRFESQGTSCFK